MVLTKAGSATPGLVTARAVEMEWRAVVAAVTGIQFVHGEEVAALAQVGISQPLRRGVDATGRDAARLELMHQFDLIATDCPRLDGGIEVGAVGKAVLDRGERGDILPALRGKLAERGPLLLGADGDGDPLVVASTSIDAVRRELRVAVAKQRRVFAAELALDVLLPEVDDAALVLGKLDERALALASAAFEGSDDG